MVTIDVKQFGAFIFDLDGVITETASLHARAWQQLFDEFLGQHSRQTGAAFVPFDPEVDYRRNVDGKSRLDGILSFLAARSIDVPAGEPRDQPEQATAHGLANRKDRYFVELLAHAGVQLFDSALALLREARGRGARIAVASSSHHCAEILGAVRLTAFFDARVDGHDLDRLALRGKPAPDIFLEAARRLGVAPAWAVVFEDAAAGVAAGRAGGFGLVIGVGRGAHAAALMESHADHVVADLSEVRLEGTHVPAARWEHFPHDADIGVRGWGPTMAAAFEQAALALTAVVTDPAHVASRQSVSVACEAPSAELLLVDWLNAVVLRMATDDLVFGAFEVAISGTRLNGRALGEPIDIARHQPAVEVKGATLTALKVAEQPDGSWCAQCVVDV
ncbi:MAG TPA: archease [Hyphomicrobiaceae bacterium]|nr:archease [Hyphomicrobiaceae bacterium]